MTASVAPPPGAEGRLVPLRPILIVGLVVLAYHYSLLSLIRGLALQTPLALVGLTPMIALLLAWIAARRGPPESVGGSLRLDFLLGRGLGVVLIGTSLVIALLVPLSVRFWLNRVDLVSLPLFVAGAIALVYGPRRLWALRFPIGFLFLAWPAPYLPLVGDGLAAFTDATIAIVAAISHVLPLATAGADGLFTLEHAGQSFVLAIGSACAGVNSLVGFFIVGTALLYVVRGSLARKVAWLAIGLGVVWLLNVIRIEAIFLVGSLFGPRAALDVLHPVAGLVVFNLGILVMLALAPRAGLSFVPLPQRPSSLSSAERRGLPKMAVGIVIAGALLMATINAGYSRYEALAGGLGQPSVTTFRAASAAIPEWSTSLVGEYEQGKQYYGASSTWDRYLYRSQDQAPLHASVPLYLDVITTDDANALAAYGVEACYRFHGYFIQSQNPIDLGSGVTGELIDYTNTKRGVDWSAVWWEWPIDEGGVTRYERVVVFMANGPSAELVGASDVAAPAADARFDATDDFLAMIGRALVAGRLASADQSPAATGTAARWI